LRLGADVQPTPGGRPSLAIGTQGQASEEEKRPNAVSTNGDGRLQRSYRAQRAQHTAVHIG